MNFEVVTFDRIFDVHRKIPLKHSKTTYFSFESKGKSRYSIEVYGWPRLREGDCVALATREPNNTQTLVGWKNLTTGELVTPNASHEFFNVLTCCAFLPVGLFNLSGATSQAGRVVAWILMVCIIIGLLTSAYKTFQRFMDAKTIRDFELPPN